MKNLDKNLIDKTEYKFRLNQTEEESVKIENLFTPFLPTIVNFNATKQDFVKPVCKHFNECGNCNLLCLNYEAQKRLKTEFIKQLMFDIDCENSVENIEGMYYPFKYRNKIHLSIGRQGGENVIGFIEESSQKVFNLEECKMHEKWVNDLIEELKLFIKHSKTTTYSKEKATGILRYAVARCLDNNLLVTLVVTENINNGLKQFYDGLKKHFKEVSLFININTTTTSAVFSDNFVLKYGEKTIPANLCGVSFNISPKSFYQTNELITSKIYKEVVNFLNVNETTNVIDAFSGIGISSLLLAKQGANVTSIEIEKSSCLDAIALAKANKLQNKITVVNEDCSTAIERIANNCPENTVLFVDPPRAGLSENFVYDVSDTGIKQIAYLSCNPITLLRDLRQFLHCGYKVVRIQPYDMFPQTKHVEVLTFLTK